MLQLSSRMTRGFYTPEEQEVFSYDGEGGDKDFMNKEAFQRGVRDGIPIALGYFAVAFTFRMMAVSAGRTTGPVSYTNQTHPTNISV